MITGSIDSNKTFDNLDFGAHFSIAGGDKFIKVKQPTAWLGSKSVWYQDDYGNSNHFNAISYDGGRPTCIPWNAPVKEYFWNVVTDVKTTIEKNISEKVNEQLSTEGMKNILQKFLDESTPAQLREELEKREPTVARRCQTFLCGAPAAWAVNYANHTIYKCETCYGINCWKNGIPLNKKTVDSLEKADSMSVSSDTTSDALLKNKHIETTKKMTTYNTLREAVIAAITELKAAGSLSAYQITTLIRQKTNQGDWEVTECAARPNNQNIMFWINHDDVRRQLGDLYANNELDALGFTGRNYNGTYLEYTFSDVTVPSDPTTYVASTTTVSAPAIVPTNVPLGSSNVALRVASFLKRHVDDVEAPTLKRIQSALKENGVTCADLAKIVEAIGGYNVVMGTVIGDYSTYYVVEQ